jgi:hypothetical protein
VKRTILLLITAVATAIAAPEEPGSAALRFLEKVRDGELDLNPGGDTALAPQTSENKRLEISRRLERLAEDLEGTTLEVGKVRIEEDLGAALIRQSAGIDPSRLQVVAVALIKRGAAWVVAPVPASFENSGIGYAPAIRQRMADLEQWMLRERTLDLENLRSQSAARMRSEIEHSLPAETLRNMSAGEVCDRFLAACAKRQLPEIRGLIGGLSPSLPDDWPLRLKAATAAVADESITTLPWRLLVSPEVLRTYVQLEEDGNSAFATIGCLDPATSGRTSKLPKIELIHLELSKSADGFWRINLPARLLHGLEDSGDSTEEDEEEDLSLDSELIDAFAQKIALIYPPTPMATIEEARDSLLKTLEHGSLKDVIHLTLMGSNSVQQRLACTSAAAQWWLFHEPSQVRGALPLAHHETEENAAALVQIFSAGNPDRFDPRVFHFKKTEKGWLWNPVPSKDTEEAFKEWRTEELARGQKHWRDSLLEASPVLTEIPANDPPIPDEVVRNLVASLIDAMRKGRIVDALKLTARLNSPDSGATLIRNIGYELIGASKDQGEAAIIGVHRGKFWSAAGASTTPGGKAAFPLYPVVQTAGGPRVILEIDLRESGSRSREFLNKASLQRLARIHPDAADDLKEVFATHQKQAAELATP